MTQEIIIGLRAKKPEFQTAFINEYGPRVHAFILDVVGDSCDADELTADVFVKAFSAIRKYDASKASLATWLLRIAHNTAISHLRRPKLLTNSIDKEIESAYTDAEEDPRIGLLHLAIMRLSPDERSLLHLHYFENAKLSDIAYALGITESTVAVRLHRIRTKLRTIIENENGE